MLSRPSGVRVVMAAVVGGCGMLMAALGGCEAPQPVPSHEWRGTDHALRVIGRRAERIDRLRARFTATAEPGDGETVSFEGVMIARRPGHLRAQGWKFDRKVFDLTRRPDGLWLWTAERAEELERHFSEQSATGTDWFDPVLQPPDAETAEVVDAGERTGRMVVRYPIGPNGEWSARLTVDRETLTVRVYEVLDPEGGVVQKVLLDRYRLVDETALPGRIRARGRFRMELELHGIALNAELPAGAFEPPSRARKLGRGAGSS